MPVRMPHVHLADTPWHIGRWERDVQPWQRKISHSPDPTAPKVGGVPQSQHFLQPHFLNHSKLAEMSDTFSMGVTCFAFMAPKDSTAIKAAPE